MVTVCHRERLVSMDWLMRLVPSNKVSTDLTAQDGWSVSLWLSLELGARLHIEDTLNCGVSCPVNELDLPVGKVRVVSVFSAIDWNIDVHFECCTHHPSADCNRIGQANWSHRVVLLFWTAQLVSCRFFFFFTLGGGPFS